MSILTFSSQPKKNVPTVATLNKSEIMSIPSISADSHWGVSSNIKNVIVVYSSEGKQKKLLKFDFEELSPQATINFSNKARNSWSISDIILLDYDGGQTQIRNGSLDVPALPLDFSGSVASPAPTITSFTKEYIDIEEEGPAVIFGPIVILTVDASNSDGSEVQSVKWYGGFTSTPTTVAAVEAGIYLSDSPSKLEIYGQQAKDLNDKFFAVVVESHGQKVFATNAPSQQVDSESPQIVYFYNETASTPGENIVFSTRVNDTFSAEAEQDLIFRYYTISGLGSYTPEELATGAGTLVRTTAVPRYSEEGVYFPYYFDAFDTGIVPVLGQTYYYAVVVEDAAGNKSSAETQAWPGL